MKKIILTIAIVFLVFQLTYAQWATSPTDVNSISNTNTGNVGIGTTAPNQLLHIFSTSNPTLKISNTTGSASSTATIFLGLSSNITNNALGSRIQSYRTNAVSSGSSDLIFSTSNGMTLYEGFRLSSSGYVGIGTTIPLKPLHVASDVAAYQFINERTSSGDAAMLYKNTVTSWITGLTVGNYVIASGTSLSTTPAATFTTNGNVGIATTDVVGGWTLAGSFYKLNVGGNGIQTTAVNVQLVGAWGDYVFKKDYKLLPIADLKVYVDQNHHLPEIPSAEQIAKEGINLGEMNKILVKKVEELTLYMIEKDKIEKSLAAQLLSQQTQIDELKKDLKRLSN